MGNASLACALGLLVLTGRASAESARDWVVLKVSRVQVAPAKTDGTTWDPRKAEEPNGCRLLGIGAAIVLGQPGGAIATFLCPPSGPKPRERDPQAPDLFVQIAIGDTKFQTPVARDTFGQVFDFPIAIPLDAIPPAGIEVRVEDMDRDVNAGELIGMVRVTKQRVLGALSASLPVLRLSDDRVERLELELAPYDLPKGSPPFRFAANQHPVATPTRARAGELVTITAQGSYSVRSSKEQIDPSGYAKGPRSYNRTPDFERSNHGGAIAYIGAPNEMHAALFVGSCVSAIAPVPGPIQVGVNDTDVKNNTGAIELTTKVSLPSVDQWRAGGGVPCPGTAEPVHVADPVDGTVVTGDALTPETILARIQSTYMAGVKRCYKEILKKDPMARGRVTLSLTINETGHTTKGAAKGFSSDVDSCIAAQMPGWRFVIPKDTEPGTASFDVTLQLVP